MKKNWMIMLIFAMLALGSPAIAAGTLEDGMTDLAQQIVKNSVANGKKSIAISSFQHINGDQSELSNYIADELVLKLFNIPEASLEIIERGQLNKIFQEMQFNMTGVVDTKTIQELGKVHGVGALVLGSITEMGESIRINARLIDTETGRVFSAAGTTIAKTATIADLLSRVIIVADQGGSKKVSGKALNSGSGAISKRSGTSKNGKSQTYSLDLNQYDIGDMPETLGSVMIANGKAMNGRVLKSFNGGSFTYNLPDLQGNFEISFKINAGSVNSGEFSLTDSSGKNFLWRFNHHYYTIKMPGVNKSERRFKSVNKTYTDYKIVGKGRVIKLFAENQFIVSRPCNSGEKFKTLTIALPSHRSEIRDITIVQK